MRWYRSDTLDELPAQPPPFRSDALREHVDKLPSVQREVISRHYFGQQPIRLVAEQLDIPERKAREALARALERLKRRVLEDHYLKSAPLREDTPDVRPLQAEGSTEA